MKINLGQLSTKNLATLAERLINSSKSGKYVIIENHPLLLSLENSYANYDAVYTKSTFSGKGKDVAQLDKERDFLFSSLKIYLSSHRKVVSLPHYEESAKLYEIFRKYGLNLDRLSYSEETAQLKKLIEELDKEVNQNYMSNLNLSTAYDELKAKQEEFELTFALQAEANADLRKLSSASSSRKELEIKLRAYINLITAMKNVPDWSNLYLDLNEIVKAAKNS